jgi:WD40 repeat protein/serine/threonine protein kinase
MTVPTTAVPASEPTPAAAGSTAARAAAPADVAPPEVASPLPTIALESYEVGAEVARGGMGRIVAARDRRLGRTVAIKEPFGDDAATRARLEREALITARLQHPAIVPVYEAGRWPSGEPFYAMKLVDGRSLRLALDEAKTLPDRLALLPHVVAVANALAYAHQRGVIHRDLKPANVLVGAFGETVVIDWGLAKDLGAHAGDEIDSAPGGPAADSATTAAAASNASASGDLTATGSILGTPAYMAPEQAERGAVDARADVYALGAMLYHVLAGVPPYAGKSAAEVLSCLAAGPPEPLARLGPELPADLVAIVETAMARRPEARYPSARELANELVRFQTGQLVATHRYSFGERVRRFLRRHRAELFVGAVMATLAVAIAVASFVRIVKERDRAERERSAAQRRSDELTLAQARAEVERDPARAIGLLRGLSGDGPWSAARVIAIDAASRGVPRLLARQDNGVGGLAWSKGGETLVSVSVGASVRVWFEGRVSIPSPIESGALSVAVSADGRLVAAGLDDGSVRLWPAAGGEGRVLGRHQGRAIGLAITPDGESVVSVGTDGVVHEWDARPRGGGRELLRHAGAGTGLALSADGRWLAEAALGGAVRLLDRQTGVVRVLGELPGGIAGLRFSADGAYLAAGGLSDHATVWSVADEKEQRLHFGAAIAGLAFAPDRAELAVVGRGDRIVLWNLTTNAQRTLPAFDTTLSTAAFSPDGRTLAVAGESGALRLWDVASQTSRLLTGHTAPIWSLAYEPRGRWIVSGAADGEVRVWPGREESGRELIATAAQLSTMALSPDRATALVAGNRSELWLVDPTRARFRQIPGRDGATVAAAFLPDGRHVVTLSERLRVRLWDLARAESRLLAGDAVGEVRVARDRARLVAPAGTSTGVLMWRDLSEPAAAPVLLATPAWVDVVAISSDGELVAGGGADGSVWLWEDPDQPPRTLARHQGGVRSLAISPGGMAVLSAGADGVVQLIAIGGGAPVVLGRHQRDAEASFSPDGKTVVTVGGDRRLTRVDVATMKSVAVTRLPAAPGTPCWGASSAVLGVPLGDGSVFRIDLDSGEGRALRGHRGAVAECAVVADGLVLGAGEDGSVRAWADLVPTDRVALRAWMSLVSRGEARP